MLFKSYIQKILEGVQTIDKEGKLQKLRIGEFLKRLYNGDEIKISEQKPSLCIPQNKRKYWFFSFIGREFKDKRGESVVVDQLQMNYTNNCKFETPIGIYTYPFEYSGTYINSGYFPFASGGGWCTLLKVSEQNYDKIWSTHNFTKETYKEKLKLLKNLLVNGEYKDVIKTFIINQKDVFIYSAMYEILDLLDNNKKISSYKMFFDTNMELYNKINTGENPEKLEKEISTHFDKIKQNFDTILKNNKIVLYFISWYIDCYIKDDIPKQMLQNNVGMSKTNDTVTKQKQAIKKHPLGNFYYLIYQMFSYKFHNMLGHNKSNVNVQQFPTVFTKLFLDLGCWGIVDEGMGFIHPNEPAQAVFFSASKNGLFEERLTMKNDFNKLKVSDTEIENSKKRTKEHKNIKMVLKNGGINYNKCVVDVSHYNINYNTVEHFVLDILKKIIDKKDEYSKDTVNEIIEHVCKYETRKNIISLIVYKILNEIDIDTITIDEIKTMNLKDMYLNSIFDKSNKVIKNISFLNLDIDDKIELQDCIINEINASNVTFKNCILRANTERHFNKCKFYDCSFVDPMFNNIQSNIFNDCIINNQKNENDFIHLCQINGGEIILKNYDYNMMDFKRLHNIYNNCKMSLQVSFDTIVSDMQTIYNNVTINSNDSLIFRYIIHHKSMQKAFFENINYEDYKEIIDTMKIQSNSVKHVELLIDTKVNATHLIPKIKTNKLDQLLWKKLSSKECYAKIKEEITKFQNIKSMTVQQCEENLEKVLNNL